MARIEWLKDVPMYDAGAVSEVKEENPTWLDVRHVGAVMKGTARWLGEPTTWAETITLPLAPLTSRAYYPDYCYERPCERTNRIGECALAETERCVRKPIKER